MKNIDLAIESRELNGEIEGVTVTTQQEEGCTITIIDVESEDAVQKIGKPVGKYITIEFENEPVDDQELTVVATSIKKQLQTMLPDSGEVLFCGLGNRYITPDSLGPLAANSVIATRHLPANEEGLSNLRPVGVIFPGVLSQTGIETAEGLRGMVEVVKPKAVVTVDALAARKLTRLAKTVQICNTGIAPGSGVGNHRSAINKSLLGCEVISIGVPLVVDSITLCSDVMGLSQQQRQTLESDKSKNLPLMVTHTEIDKTVSMLSKAIALGFNMAVQPSLTTEDILSIMS